MNLSDTSRKDFLASGIRSQSNALLSILRVITHEPKLNEEYIKEELKLVEANVRRLRKTFLI